tara:strand:- start:480 stop:683 length:204 start_codon:yes stop_codon:yes gene_type:complete
METPDKDTLCAISSLLEDVIGLSKEMYRCDGHLKTLAAEATRAFNAINPHAPYREDLDVEVQLENQL